MQAVQEVPTRILVATEEAVTREILVPLLRMAGYEPLPAPTGERALLILREDGRSIRGLITDVDLPRLVDGWILADEFRRLHPAQPVVLAVEDPQARQAEGAVFIRKPMSPPEVLTSLQRLYGRPEARPVELASDQEVALVEARPQELSHERPQELSNERPRELLGEFGRELPRERVA